jgi:hypothetical protein
MYFDNFTIYANKLIGDNDIRMLRGYIVLGKECYDFEALFYAFEVGISKNVRAWFSKEAEAKLRKLNLGAEAIDHLIISLQNRLLVGDVIREEI